MSIVCSIVILYAKYLVKMLRMVLLRNKKMFRDRTEATLFQHGTVPLPVPVLSLTSIFIYLCYSDLLNQSVWLWSSFRCLHWPPWCLKPSMSPALSFFKTCTHDMWLEYFSLRDSTRPSSSPFMPTCSSTVLLVMYFAYEILIDLQ